jgi:CubicO group peptidase (beta-lactamase class C family)
VSLVRPPDSGDLVLALLTLLQAAPAFSAATFDPIVRDGIRLGGYPGAVLAVGTADSVLYIKGYGRLTWSAGSAPADPDHTLYDLASLTKVVATTTAVMVLVDRGRVQLDAPVVRYLPEFNGAGTGAITVRQLLTHTSGLRGDLPLPAIRGARDSTALLRLAYAETPLVRPGSRVVYSDVNAVLLGEIVRRASGEALDAFVSQEVFLPLELTETRYRPGRSVERRTAPTGVWRGHPVAGVVNDPTAAKLGGVSGNAGVFSTARDVARFAQFILREGQAADGRRVVRAETVRAFTTRAVYFGPGTEARALGWQAVPTGETVSSAGSRFGPRSVGHTGWTGTSLWIDPDRGLFVVLLTNRAFAPRSRKPFTVVKGVRGRLADAAAEAIDARTR